MNSLKTFLTTTRELCEKATPGPWFHGSWSGYCELAHHGRIGHPGPPACEYTFKRRTDDDYAKETVSSGATENMEIATGLNPGTAAFIANARSSLPLALDLLALAVEALGKASRTREEKGLYCLDGSWGESPMARARECLAAIDELTKEIK